MTAGGAPAERSAIRVWADLARAGNFPSVASNVVAALVLSRVAGPSWPEPVLLWVAVLSGCFAYAGGATFNDVADAHFDAARQPWRPIPQRAVSRTVAAWLGVTQLAVAVAGLLFLGASPFRVGLLVAVIAAYDWLHKRWGGSVLLMGGCRALLALSIASLPGHTDTPALLIWVGSLFVYIVVLSVIARREAGLARQGGEAARARAQRIGRWVGQLLAAMPLVDAAALAVVGAWLPAAVCLLAYPLGRLAQRLAAST